MMAAAVPSAPRLLRRWPPRVEPLLRLGVVAPAYRSATRPAGAAPGPPRPFGWERGEANGQAAIGQVENVANLGSKRGELVAVQLAFRKALGLFEEVDPQLVFY